MIAAFMAYSLSAGILLALAAWGFEGVFRAFRRPARFVWLFALLGTTVLAVAAPLRRESPDSRGTEAFALADELDDAALQVGAPEPESWYAGVQTTVVALRDRTRTLLESPSAFAARVGVESNRTLAYLWLFLTLAVFGTAGATALRYRALRRSWPSREVDGIPVRISPGTGPALIGVLKPEIVLPAWLLDAPPEERRLALLHEGEHLRTGDSYLLTAGCLVAALLPWNLPVWWMLHRLRLALEIDCDDRVLRHGVDHRNYGTMLIDVTGQRTGLTLGSPALAGFPSQLERRLLAMTMKRSKSSTLRGGVLGIVGVAAVLAACDASMPTAAEIEAMDAETAIDRMEELGFLVPGAEVRFMVDGVDVTEEEVRAIPAEEVSTVVVRRTSPGQPAEPRRLMITTRSGDAGDQASSDGGLNVRFPAGEPLILIDNVPATLEEFNLLNPAEIETVSLLKDEAAAAYGAQAANGVILVRMKGSSTAEGTRPLPPEVAAAPTPPPARLQIRDMGEPLYLIDDVPATAADFNRLDPSTIETVSLLKEDAAAIYGYRGANGVVLVRTKSYAAERDAQREQREELMQEFYRTVPPSNVSPPSPPSQPEPQDVGAIPSGSPSAGTPTPEAEPAPEAPTGYQYYYAYPDGPIRRLGGD